MFKHISNDTDYKQGSWEFLDGNNSACLSSCFIRISVANNIGPFAEFLSKFSGQSDLDWIQTTTTYFIVVLILSL